MAKILRWLLVAGTAFFPLQSARAWFDTAQLEAVCQAGLDSASRDNPMFTVCVGAGLGILQADALEANKICAPKDLDSKTALRTFLSYAQATPNKKIEGLVTFYRSLAAAFPCRK